MKLFFLSVLFLSLFHNAAFSQVSYMKSLDSLIIDKDTSALLQAVLFNDKLKTYLRNNSALIDSSSLTVIRDNSAGYRVAYNKVWQVLGALNSSDKRKVVDNCKSWIRTTELFDRILANSGKNLVCIVYSSARLQKILFKKEIENRDCGNFSTYENNNYYYLAINGFIKLDAEHKVAFLETFLDNIRNSL